jgi:hypothetical protein
MKYKYEIDQQNTIRVWDLENPNENNAPFLLQPYNPANGQVWSDQDTAKQWIEAQIEEWNKPPIEQPEEITE